MVTGSVVTTTRGDRPNKLFSTSTYIRRCVIIKLRHLLYCNMKGVCNRHTHSIHYELLKEVRGGVHSTGHLHGVCLCTNTCTWGARRQREREHAVSLQITLSEATSSIKEQCLATTQVHCVSKTVQNVVK